MYTAAGSCRGTPPCTTKVHLEIEATAIRSAIIRVLDIPDIHEWTIEEFQVIEERLYDFGPRTSIWQLLDNLRKDLLDATRLRLYTQDLLDSS